MHFRADTFSSNSSPRSAAAASSCAEKTFSLQGTLPRLPVPALEATLEKFKQSIKPFILDDDASSHQESSKTRQWQTALKAIDDFAKGMGPVLQQRLIDYARTQSVSLPPECSFAAAALV